MGRAIKPVRALFICPTSFLLRLCQHGRGYALCFCKAVALIRIDCSIKQIGASVMCHMSDAACHVDACVREAFGKRNRMAANVQNV